MDLTEQVPVKTLDRGARGHAVLLDHFEHGAHEFGRFRRFVRVIGVVLELDIEPRVIGPQRLDPLEQGSQRGNAFTIDRPLAGKVARVAAAGVDAPHVEARDFVQTQCVERAAPRLQPLAAGAARDVGVGRGVVRDDRHAVGAEHHIEFQRAHTNGQRLLESGQRVFRRQSASPAMSLRIKSQGRTSAPQRQANGGGAAPAQPGEALNGKGRLGCHARS